ncbi:MAG: serine/threonine-protein phosphatase [Solobacterium sp.]|nr:serine/threonine-protein phosphatase [Solobacterium sp.]
MTGTKAAQKGKKKISVITQAALLFAAALIMTGILASVVLYRTSIGTVMQTLTTRAQASAADVEGFIRQYPASEWLLNYWHDNGTEMDIEYDAVFDKDNETAAKLRLLVQRHPEFQAEYADTEDVLALPEEDRQLYAEIVYSWLITSVNQIQLYHGFDYLMCVCTDEPYDTETVLFIGAQKGQLRGDEKGQVYPVGKVIEVTPEQQKAIKKAAGGEPQTAYNEDGRYLDYYDSIGSAGGHDLLLILSQNVTTVHETTLSRAVYLALIDVMLLVVLACLCMLMMHKAVLSPMKKVQDSIRLYKDTKDSAAVIRNLTGVRTHNELEQLSEDVADMTREIDAYIDRIEQITSERERISTEMDLACRIQTSVLPNEFPAFPDRNEFDIYASMTPAREVGGDFYNFSLVDEDHLCLVIADVSGKSVPAALFMMAVKITIDHYAREGGSPAGILTKVNEAVCRHNPEEMFVTIWLGILDLKTGVLTAVNAGHEYPMVKEPDGDFELLRDRHGLVLGADPDVFYTDYEIRMKPGSKLFVYTDGLAEAQNVSGAMFGTEGILKVLNADKEGDAYTILRNMMDAAYSFAGEKEQFDDLTMMCLVYNGPKQDA